MRIVVLCAALAALSACTPINTAAGTLGGAAMSTVDTVGGWFTGSN